jgi:hypothetical protein
LRDLILWSEDINRHSPDGDVERYDALRVGMLVMRLDPANAAIVIMLRSLKMYGMAQAVGELTEQGLPVVEAAVPILSQLLKAATAEREVRSIAYQIKSARFPAYKDTAWRTISMKRSFRILHVRLLAN